MTPTLESSFKAMEEHINKVKEILGHEIPKH